MFGQSATQSTKLLRPFGHRRSAEEGATLRVEIVCEGRTIEGTCFLVHKEPRARDVVLYFLTCASFFRIDAAAHVIGDPCQVRLIGEDGKSLESTSETVLLPRSDTVDVAIVRVTVPFGEYVPFPIVLTNPPFDTAFVALAYRADGSPVYLRARVRFRSPRMVVGDRTIRDGHCLIGAPAIIGGRVFGIVSECSPHHGPMITLLSSAHEFIRRNITGWTSTLPADSESFVA